MSCVPHFELFRGAAWPFTVDELLTLAAVSVTSVSDWKCEASLCTIDGAVVLRANTEAEADAATIGRALTAFSWIWPNTVDLAPTVYRLTIRVMDEDDRPQIEEAFITVKPTPFTT